MNPTTTVCLGVCLRYSGYVFFSGAVSWLLSCSTPHLLYRLARPVGRQNPSHPPPESEPDHPTENQNTGSYDSVLVLLFKYVTALMLASCVRTCIGNSILHEATSRWFVRLIAGSLSRERKEGKKKTQLITVFGDQCNSPLLADPDDKLWSKIEKKKTFSVRMSNPSVLVVY
jgi:hypothetical protein